MLPFLAALLLLSIIYIPLCYFSVLLLLPVMVCSVTFIALLFLLSMVMVFYINRVVIELEKP